MFHPLLWDSSQEVSRINSQGGKIMKKKALALVLTGATAVSLLAGCGSAAQAPAGASSAAATTEAAAEETTAASEASSETSGAASTEAAADSTWPENVDLKASSYNEAAPDWTE